MQEVFASRRSRMWSSSLEWKFLTLQALKKEKKEGRSSAFVPAQSLNTLEHLEVITNINNNFYQFSFTFNPVTSPHLLFMDIPHKHTRIVPPNLWWKAASNQQPVWRQRRFTIVKKRLMKGFFSHSRRYDDSQWRPRLSDHLKPICNKC